MFGSVALEGGKGAGGAFGSSADAGVGVSFVAVDFVPVSEAFVALPWPGGAMAGGSALPVTDGGKLPEGGAIAGVPLADGGIECNPAG